MFGSADADEPLDGASALAVGGFFDVASSLLKRLCVDDVTDVGRGFSDVIRSRSCRMQLMSRMRQRLNPAAPRLEAARLLQTGMKQRRLAIVQLVTKILCVF